MMKKAARIAVLGLGLVGATGSAATGCGAPSGLDACEASDGRATLGLEDFCKDVSCPPTPEVAVEAACAAGHRFVTVRTGCGLVQVSIFDFVGYSYVYSDGQLVGASFSSDVPTGPCNTFDYVAGVTPPHCPTATECFACASDPGAAGAGGAGGATSGAGGAGQGEGVTYCE